MNDFLIALFLGTRIGRILLGLIVAYCLVMVVGWALVPILAILIGGICIQEYSLEKKCRGKGTKVGKTPLIVGIFFLVFALLFIIGSVYYQEKKRLAYKTPLYYDDVPSKTEETIDDDTYVPDSVITTKMEKPKSVRASHPSTSSSQTVSSYYFSSSYLDDDDEEEDDDDNMRGFDPASEDDMEDNGMSRYMENTDDEGWD